MCNSNLNFNSVDFNATIKHVEMWSIQCLREESIKGKMTDVIL